MPTVTQAVTILSEEFGYPIERLRLLSRKLIDHEMLPKSVGSRIPQVTASHVSRLIIAMYASDTVALAPEVVRQYGILPHNGGSVKRYLEDIEEALDLGLHAKALDIGFTVAGGFLAHFIEMFVHDASALNVLERAVVEICATYPDVLFRDAICNPRGGYSSAHFYEAGGRGQMGGWFKPRIVAQIPAAAFAALGVRWRDTAPSRPVVALSKS